MMEDMNYQHVRLAEVYDLDNPWGQDNDFYFGLAGPGTSVCWILVVGRARCAVSWPKEVTG